MLLDNTLSVLCAAYEVTDADTSDTDILKKLKTEQCQ